MVAGVKGMLWKTSMYVFWTLLVSRACISFMRIVHALCLAPWNSFPVYLMQRLSLQLRVLAFPLLLESLFRCRILAIQ